MVSLATTSSETNPSLATCISLAHKLVCRVLEGILPSQLPRTEPAIYTSNQNPTANPNHSPTNFKIHLT